MAGDVDHVIRVEVTATNVGGSAASESAPTDLAEPAPPVNTAVPVVSGTFEDGETLTATTGTWTGTETIDYDYQWVRCELDGSGCEDIDGATAATYDLTPADVGHRIVVEVTASNDGGQATAASAPSTGVGIDPPANTGAPEADGTPVDGETLTADPGTWTGTGPIDFEYQWQRCDADGDNCEDIDGATDETYTLGTDDIGSTVRVEVTADNGDRTTVPSAAVGPVAATPPVSLTAPVVTGTAAEGETLSAGDGTWDGSDPLTFEHQWQRCDEDGDELRRHRRRHGRRVHADRRRRRPRDRGRRDREQRRGRRVGRLGADRRDAARAARQHHAAPGPHRHADRRRDADGRPRHVDRRRAARRSSTSGSAATRTARTARTSTARRARPTRRPATTPATRSWSWSPRRTPAAPPPRRPRRPSRWRPRRP